MTEDFRREGDRAMHSQSLELLQRVGEIKGSLTAFVEAQKEHNQRIDGRFDKIDCQFDKIDERLREVEKKSAVAAAVVGGIISVAVNLAGFFLGPKQ